MTNKGFNLITCVDKKLRRLFPTQMWKDHEIIVTIEMFGGFEFFNTRPYHNYENWSSGYRVTAGERYGNISVTAEDLDEALNLLENKLIATQNCERCNNTGKYTRNGEEVFCTCLKGKKMRRRSTEEFAMIDYHPCHYQNRGEV